MSLNIRSLLVLIGIAFFVVSNMAAPMRKQGEILDTILESFKHDTKKLFKVWHFLYDKKYDFNTLEGLNKYRTFKNTLKEIEAHNSDKQYTYKIGLNHLSDMTNEEVIKYYNLQPFREEDFARGMRKLKSFNLDDYNDEDDIIAASPKAPPKRESVDYRDKMRPVRNQGTCGSCWAFASQALLEGAHNIHGSQITDHFSTQHLIDCNTKSRGCNGGSFRNVLEFFSSGNKIIYEAEYPYEEIDGVCRELEKKSTNLAITSYRHLNDGKSDFDLFLANGPFGVGVNVDYKFNRYKSGVFNGPCSAGLNHAVVAVGFNTGSSTEKPHYIIRNSWGTTWGEDGYIRIAAHLDQKACNIERIGFQPIV